MRLPNKISTYKESIISKMPILLEQLSEIEKTPDQLYISSRGHFNSMGDFLTTLDCLYTLGKIGYDNDRRKLYAK